MEFSRQEYWNRLLFPIPGDLPHPEIKPVSSALAGDVPFEHIFMVYVVSVWAIIDGHVEKNDYKYILKW